MVLDINVIIILVVTAIVSAIGFKKYVWFFSIGYGFSVAAIGATLMILFKENLSIFNLIACLVLMVYGLRLGGFLAWREFKNKTYSKKMGNEIKDGSRMNYGIKSMIWICCFILYFLMCSPIIFRFMNGSKTDSCLVIGLIIAIIGMLIEIIADAQKNNQKKENPNRFCDKGLYKIVRCPNYFGELVLWFGIYLSGISIYSGTLQWIIATLGLVGIIYVMFSGTKRIETRQDKNYGEDEEYKEYIKKTPILLPFIPIYSVKKHKWLVA